MEGRTTGIRQAILQHQEQQLVEWQFCDLLTADRRMVHVQRHFGSRDLSHLFSRGAVAAELLQSDVRASEMKPSGSSA